MNIGSETLFTCALGLALPWEGDKVELGGAET